MSSSSNRIVRLNVGGTKYEVAKSTINRYPGTMLARLISDTWTGKGDGGQNQETDDQKEIFVDADGQQFRFVLEYMRHQQVDLPMKISKKSVLKELKYFGFEDVRDNAISCGRSEVPKHMITFSSERKAEIKRRRKETADRLKKVKEESEHQTKVTDFMDIAYHCVMCYNQLDETLAAQRRVTIPDTYYDKYFNYQIGLQICQSNVTLFNKALAEYGLRYFGTPRARGKPYIYITVLEESAK